MTDRLRTLVSSLVASWRDNPLVRYGSPARRLNVPRALWWLAMGLSLLSSAVACLIELIHVPEDSDPFLPLMGATMLLMPMLAAVSFLGFGFPYREAEHLDELQLAGMKPTDLVTGLLWWPVVACGLVAAGPVVCGGLVSVVCLVVPDTFVSWERLVWRGGVSILLLLWTLLCLAVALRAWMVPRRSGVMVLAACAGGTLVHTIWIVALHVKLFGIAMEAMIAYGAGWMSLGQVIVEGVALIPLPNATTAVMMGLLLACAVVLEVWLAARSTWRLFSLDDAPPPRWLSGRVWPALRPPTVEATTEWVLGLLLFSVVCMVAIGELGGMGWFVTARLYSVDGDFRRIFPGHLPVGTQPGLVVAVVLTATAVLAAWSVRWRLPSIDTRGRSLPSALVVIALLAAVSAVLYGLLAEAVVIEALGTLLVDPRDIVNPWTLSNLQPFVGSLLLTVGLSVVVLATVRAARWPWAVALAWFGLLLWTVWPARLVTRNGWYNEDDVGTHVFAWFPHTGRSGLLWLILGIAVCLAIKKRALRAATEPR